MQVAKTPKQIDEDYAQKLERFEDHLFHTIDVKKMQRAGYALKSPVSFNLEECPLPSHKPLKAKEASSINSKEDYLAEEGRNCYGHMKQYFTATETRKRQQAEDARLKSLGMTDQS